MDGYRPQIVDLNLGFSADDLWIHDESDFYKAQILTRFFDDPTEDGHLPRPFGVFYEGFRPCYEEELELQVEEAVAIRGRGDLDKLLQGKETWEIH